MESEKVKEIKWTLQGFIEQDIFMDRYITPKDCLTLINELESENEKLKQHKRELEGGQRDLLKVIKEFDKETQQLKDRIAELGKIGLNEDITVAEYLREMQRLKDMVAELEKENDKLKQHKQELQGGQQDLVRTIKAQHERIAELEKDKNCVWEEWTDGDHSIWCCSNCKEDFCFMEGDVYENNYGYCPHCGAKITALKELKEDDIDEILKEFINEQ